TVEVIADRGRSVGIKADEVADDLVRVGALNRDAASIVRDDVSEAGSQSPNRVEVRRVGDDDAESEGLRIPESGGSVLICPDVVAQDDVDDSAAALDIDAGGDDRSHSICGNDVARVRRVASDLVARDADDLDSISAVAGTGRADRVGPYEVSPDNVASSGSRNQDSIAPEVRDVEASDG